MKRALFRADAFPAIGTGDLLSLIYLAAEFEKRGIVTHFCIKDYPASLKIIESREITRKIVISKEAKLIDELQLMDKYMDENKIKILVMQINERQDNDYKPLFQKYETITININGKMPVETKLVINWDVEFDGIYDKKILCNTKFLLGPEYVILPSEFFNNEKKRDFNIRNKNKILVAMGGADELNYTEKVVRRLAEEKNPSIIKIILGAGYTEIKKLENFLSNSGLKYEIKNNVLNMFDEYMDCDYSIGAGGLTSYELVTTQTPCHLIALYEHQIKRCVYFHVNGWANYIGYRPDLNKFNFSPPPFINSTRFKPKLYQELFDYI